MNVGCIPIVLPLCSAQPDIYKDLNFTKSSHPIAIKAKLDK